MAAGEERGSCGQVHHACGCIQARADASQGLARAVALALERLDRPPSPEPLEAARGQLRAALSEYSRLGPPVRAALPEEVSP